MDILNIIAFVLSIVGIIISLLLFNASINNGRKILINKIIYRLIYEICFMFSEHTRNEDKIKKRTEWERSMIQISKMIDDIRLDDKHGVPTIPIAQQFNNEEGTVTENISLNCLLNNVSDYLEKRNIFGFKLLLENYDGRIYATQHYRCKYVYKRLLLVGPIVGVKIILIRSNKEAKYGLSSPVEITPKKIKNMKDLEYYYKNTYLLFPAVIEKVSFERKLDITRTIKKGEELIFNLWR
jgi:hypothetical protein